MDQKWFFRFYRLARLQRCYTKQPKDQVFQNVMTCTASDIELVSSSNIIFHITTGAENGFFTPIYQHKDMAMYLKQATHDYYTYICKDTSFASADLEIILNDLSDSEKMKRFSHMGSIWYPDSPISRFMKTGNPKIIGLESFPDDEKANDRLRSFIRTFACGAIHAYKQNSMVGNGRWQTAGANHTLAVEALAEILGLSYMIPHAEYRVLVVDGIYKCLGLYMECAPGQDLTKIPQEERRRLLSPQLQRELNRLSILDAITCENDHCPENYHLVIQQDRAEGISVFDNNSAQNFTLRWDVSVETILKCAPYVDSRGFLNRPYVDAQIVERVNQISFCELLRGLLPYLSFLPIFSLYIRIKRIQRAIQKSLAAGTIRSLRYEEWNEHTVEQELQLSQTKTYLHSYLYDCIHV